MSSKSNVRSFLQSSLGHQNRPANPEQWWHAICKVTPNLCMSGGISNNNATARKQLSEWEAAGVTHYIAVHEECNRGHFVATNSTIEYIYMGVDDDGGKRDPKWFDEVTSTALKILEDPNAVLMITCWMGVNRGPSATYAVLLALGWEPRRALHEIRTVRPIACTIYSVDATKWWVKRTGGDSLQVRKACADVEQWHVGNPLDMYHVNRAIGSRTGA